MRIVALLPGPSDCPTVGARSTAEVATTQTLLTAPAYPLDATTAHRAPAAGPRHTDITVPLRNMTRPTGDRVLDTVLNVSRAAAMASETAASARAKAAVQIRRRP